MQEKDAALSDDYGKDVASVQALHMKHEGFQVKDRQYRCFNVQFEPQH